MANSFFSNLLDLLKSSFLVNITINVNCNNTKVIMPVELLEKKQVNIVQK